MFNIETFDDESEYRPVLCNHSNYTLYSKDNYQQINTTKKKGKKLASFRRKLKLKWSSVFGAISDILCPLGHLVAVPPRAVRVRRLHLRVQLTTAGEVVDGLEGEGGLVPGEVQRQIHYRRTGNLQNMRECFTAFTFHGRRSRTVHQEAEIFPHEKKGEFSEPLGIVLHHAPAAHTLVMFMSSM